MNKTNIKTFATYARKELLKKVTMKAMEIGITEEKIQKAQIESSDAVFIDGKQLSYEEKIKRDKLIERMNQLGFHRVIEEVAYTWFNRFTAIRFMEVNDYLPTRVRALSSIDPYSSEPDMVKEAANVTMDIDKNYVYELKMANETEELFKYLILKLCNELNEYMPFMFEKIEDYTEILFPDGLLSADSFIRMMTNSELIPEGNWKDIEIIGWLYQYYISDEKDRVFKQRKKYAAEEIPFATQLFTPNWIVRYLVQNSLGRYWVEAHREHEELTIDWEFYINRDETIYEKIPPYTDKGMKIEEVKFLDPAMGSGHILVYTFDVFYEIYRKCGYLEREIPRLIIENNLYGLDIDDRAYQLACFSLVMKGMEKNSRFLRTIKREGLQLNLASIQETNDWKEEEIAFLAGEEIGDKFSTVKKFIDQFHNGKTYGSLMKIDVSQMSFLEKRLQQIEHTPEHDLFQMEVRKKVINELPHLLKQAKMMTNTYDVVTLNPPYMGSSRMNKELAQFLRKNYPDSKGDLFAAFMEIDHYIKENGFYAAINQHSWMFLSSFEKLRNKILRNKWIDTMFHLGPRAFEEIGGEVVQSTAFVLRNTVHEDMDGIYFRLVDGRSSQEKRKLALDAVKSDDGKNRYTFKQKDFFKIPSSPIAYWVSEKIRRLFETAAPLGTIAEPKQGMTTSDNKRFLRMWYEVNMEKIGFGLANREVAKKSNFKWFPYNKGGEFRKWYGNMDYIVNYENDGEELEQFHAELNKTSSGGRLKNRDYYFKEGITWSFIGTSRFGVRYSPQGFIFDVAGSSLFPDKKDVNYILAFLTSNIAYEFLKILNPTMNFQAENIKKLPIVIDKSKRETIDKLVDENIAISKSDWDSFETSWNFTKHPLLTFPAKTVEEAYEKWEQHKNAQFHRLKQNEEKLNELFLQIYDLEDEISPQVAHSDVTILQGDLLREIKSFISYAVGCMFGRYSLDEEGLICAGGQFDITNYKTFQPDEDNILPILPGAYFEDDIVSRFVQFLQVTFGEGTLEENLHFIANAIGRKGNETARESLRRYFLNDFYKDHVQTYKKRPIYWLITSGKEKAFNCLIYIHRYDKTTLSRIRTDYLHEVQTRYETIRRDLVQQIEEEHSSSDIRAAKKELLSIDKKIKELKLFDEKLHHMADMQIELNLDDGVRVNYEKLKPLCHTL